MKYRNIFDENFEINTNSIGVGYSKKYNCKKKKKFRDKWKLKESMERKWHEKQKSINLDQHSKMILGSVFNL